jgi:hypothetical protein
MKFGLKVYEHIPVCSRLIAVLAAWRSLLS